MVRSIGCTLLACLLLLVSTGASAADGDLLSRETYVPKIGYAEWFALVYEGGKPAPSDKDPALDPVKGAAYFTPELYAELTQQTKVSVERIAYESDGLRIDGFLVQPKDAGSHPTILFLRGGNRDFGAINTRDLLLMTSWAKRGYVVLASNYRGSPRSEGQDEFGGTDIHDVTALVPLVRRLPSADPDRLFLYGESRGGIMVYRALRGGVQARAVAVNGGVSDLNTGERPELEEVYAELMPDYAVEKANRFCRRSAICWPQDISAPVLMLAATGDWRVGTAQPLVLAARLQALGKPYSLRIVQGGMHIYLDEDQQRIDDDVLGFFEANGAHAR